MNILVLDVGSSGMRGIIYKDSGRSADRKHISYAPVFGENGMIVEQDPLSLKNALWSILRWAGETEAALEAICLTSQRSSCICIGNDGQPIGNVICWQDKRTIPLIRELENNGEIIAELSGAWINPVFLGPKLTWVRRNLPEVYENTWKFMTIADYLMFLMTGQALTDDTYGSRTHLMNINTRKWDDELLSIFEVEKEKLVRIVPVGSMVGSISNQVSKETGLGPGIPVYTAGGDQQCALIGQGAFDEKTVSVTLGTGEFIGTCIPTLPEKRSGEVIYNCASVPGKYIIEYGAATCASAFDWLRREIYGNLPAEQIAEELDKTSAGAGGCVVLPYFQGRMTPDHNSNAEAVFSGISLSTRKEDMLRALIEAIGVETWMGIEKLGTDPKRVHVSGGMSKTMQICQIIADVTGRELLINEEADATALGAFLVTGTSLGIFSSIEEGYEQICGSREMVAVNPRKEYAEIYDDLKRANKDLYNSIRDVTK